MFGRQRQKGNAVLVADVDDTSVGVCILQTTASGPARILVSDRQTLPIENRSPAQGASAITQLLETCADAVVKKYQTDTPRGAPPSAVYAIIKAPWTRFRTVQAEEEFEKEQMVTQDIVTSISKKALTIPSELDAANILEAGTMRVYLNGYPTGQPVGKRASRVAVIAYQSDVHRELKDGVVAVLGKILPGRRVTVRSSMCALLAALSEHLPDVHRFVILDVGGSATNCAVILKELVSQTVVVPEGKSTIIQKIAGAGLPEEILTQLRMLATDTCADDACKALKDSLARTEPDLAKVFGEGFAKIAAKRRLPNAAMLSAPTELSSWMAGFFSRIDFSQFTATMQPFTVEQLTAEHMRDAVTWDTGTPDTSLGVAASYVNILGREA